MAAARRTAKKPSHNRLHRPHDWSVAASICAALTLYWLVEGALTLTTPDVFTRARFAYSVGSLLCTTLSAALSGQTAWRLWQNLRGADRQAALAAALSCATLLGLTLLWRRYLPLAVLPWPLYAALLARRAAPGRLNGSGTTSATAG
jgi:hypothetical protein